MKKLASTSPDPQSCRGRILHAAEQVVARDGVSNLTLDAVAREAGISKGGLLYHFPSKSDLIHAVVEEHAVHCEQEQCRVLKETPLEAGAFTRAYLQIRSEPPDPQELPIHMALLAAAGTDPEFLEPWRRRMVGWQARLESDGIDPVTATIVRLAIDGLCLSTLLGLPTPQSDLREAVLKRLLTMTQSPADRPVAAKGASTVKP